MENTNSKRKRNTVIVTASSMACLFTCARKYYLSYECGWRKRTTEDALRFGTAFHKGLEEWLKHGDVAVAVREAFATAGEADSFDAETSAQLTALLGGYFARYSGVRIGKVEPEREFAVRFPFLRGVVVCGKMDGLVFGADGKTRIIEHKTTSEDVSPMSDYWATINRDQIALYKAAAQKDGIDVSEVIYDVIRKPTIRIGKAESADEYRERLANDCVGEPVGDNPRAKEYRRGADFYFQRKTIPLLSSDMDALARRLWMFVKTIRMMRKEAKAIVSDGGAAIEAYPKCGSVMTCKACPFRGGACNCADLPETDWERGRMFEELTVAKKYL